MPQHNLHHVTRTSDSKPLSSIPLSIDGPSINKRIVARDTSGAVTKGGSVSSLASAFWCLRVSAYIGCCFAFFCLQDEGDHPMLSEEGSESFCVEDSLVAGDMICRDNDGDGQEVVSI